MNAEKEFTIPKLEIFGRMSHACSSVRAFNSCFYNLPANEGGNKFRAAY